MRIGTQENQGSTKLKLYRDVYNFQGRVEIIVSQTTPQYYLLPYLLPQNHPKTKSSFYIQGILSCVVTVKEHLKNP